MKQAYKYCGVVEDPSYEEATIFLLMNMDKFLIEPKEGKMEYQMIVYKKPAGWRWKIVHKNKHILSSSESYSSKRKAKQTAKNFYDKAIRKKVCVFVCPE